MCICITCHSQRGIPGTVWLTSGAAWEEGTVSHTALCAKICVNRNKDIKRDSAQEKEEEGKNITWCLRQNPVPCVFMSMFYNVCVCALQCTLLCVFPVYRMELLRRDSEIFFLCASSNVSQPSQVMCRKWQVYRCSLTGIICRPCAASNCRVQLNSGGLTEEYRDTHTFTEVQKARL